MKNILLKFCYGIFIFTSWVLSLWIGTMINVFQYITINLNPGTLVGAIAFLGTILGLSFSLMIIALFPIFVCLWFDDSLLKYNLIDRKE